jgi:hypothetical protein
MNSKQPLDPVKSLIEAAQPEMSRMKHSAEVGFDSRLRATLKLQVSTALITWEAAINRSLQVAVGVTSLIVLQFAIWFTPRIGDGTLLTNFTLERLLLGI